jgi:hypothetical protein
MVIYENNFPDFLEAITIGPNPDFLKNNTTYCEVVSTFPHEVDLMYEWKNLRKSSEPMRSLRDFCKKFIMYGRNLDVQTINFFVKKVNNFPEYYSKTVKSEIADSFDVATQMSKSIIYKNADGIDDIEGSDGLYSFDDSEDGVPAEHTYISYGQPPNTDTKFLSKLASLLNSCNSPCNYFKPVSDTIGTLFDFGMGMSDSSHSFLDIGSDLLHAPLNMPTAIYNKIAPQFRSEVDKLKVAGSALVKNGIAPFFSKEDKDRVKSQLQNNRSPDMAGEILPLTGDTKTYQTVSEVHSELMSKVKNKLGDCFRMFDHNRRYNPYDNEMNGAISKRKYMGIKNSDVSSLIDIHGSLAPGQYATENTYVKSLDAQPSQENRRHVDAVVKKKYDSYNSPSGAGAAVVTAGGVGGVNTVQATGSEASSPPPPAGAGLESVPTTGRSYTFDYGEVKLTSYGERGDKTPDTGSEIGLGTRGMIVPLRTVAVNPEAIDSKMVKYGDVLIINCETRSGTKFTERRQVGDVSERGLLLKGTADGNGRPYKFLIDEFVPDNTYKSRLAHKSKDLKLTITVSDTKEPLPKWNPQEASQFAAMFVCKSDWIRVKYYARNSKDYKSYYLKMDSEYRKFCKWNDSDPVNEQWLTKWAKVPQPWTT